MTAYRRSKQTRKAFCLRAGIAVTTLDCYLRRENARQRQQPGLVAVAIQPNIEYKAGTHLPLVLVFPNGFRLAIGVGFDEGTLRRVFAALA